MPPVPTYLRKDLHAGKSKLLRNELTYQFCQKDVSNGTLSVSDKGWLALVCRCWSSARRGRGRGRGRGSPRRRWPGTCSAAATTGRLCSSTTCRLAATNTSTRSDALGHLPPRMALMSTFVPLAFGFFFVKFMCIICDNYNTQMIAYRIA